MRTGDWYFESTLQKNLWPGIPPSRANAYIMRLLDVMENVPQKNIAPITITYNHPRAQLPITHDAHRVERRGSRTDHKDNCALLADGVQKDLRDGLARRRADGRVKVLNGEEEAEEKEPSEDVGHADSHDNAYRARHCCVARLLGHLCARQSESVNDAHGEQALT